MSLRKLEVMKSAFGKDWHGNTYKLVWRERGIPPASNRIKPVSNPYQTRIKPYHCVSKLYQSVSAEACERVGTAMAGAYAVSAALAAPEAASIMVERMLLLLGWLGRPGCNERLRKRCRHACHACLHGCDRSERSHRDGCELQRRVLN